MSSVTVDITTAPGDSFLLEALDQLCPRNRYLLDQANTLLRLCGITDPRLVPETFKVDTSLCSDILPAAVGLGHGGFCVSC